MKLPLFLCTLLVLTPITAAAQDTVNAVLAGTGPGGGLMRELSAADGSELASATPFGPTFNGGVRVASGDISGDGTDDFIVGSGFGAGQVSVLDGDDLSVIWTFAPFGPSFAGGVYVASGDIDGDSRADVIVGKGVGGGQVRVYSGADHSLIVTRTPFGSSYLGGVTVAAGDITGDTRADLVVGKAIGGTLRVLDGVTGATVMTKSPFGSMFLGGVNVAAGDVNGDGRTDAIAAPGLLLRQVKVYNGHDGNVLASFTPYPTGGIGGVTVAAGRVDADLHDDIITGPGPFATPTVKIFSGLNQSEIRSFPAFNAAFLGGVYVAGVHQASGGPEFTSADNTTFQVGVLGTFEVTTSGGSPALSSSGPLPAGVTFTDNTDGTATLEGTPQEGTGGVYVLTFTADDGVNPPATQTFTLTVNESPEITSANNDTFNAGQADSFTVTTTGFPTPSLSHTGALPTGVTFTDNGDGTATIGGTPTQSGDFPIQITATNGVSPDAVQDFTLMVDCAAITVNPSSLADGLYQQPYGPVTFTQSGGTPPITWSATGLPAGLSIDSSSGVLSGTPTTTVVNAAVTVTATSSNGCQGSRDLTLTIRPVATNDTYTGGVGGTQFAVGVTVLTPNVFVNGNVTNNDAGPAPLNVTFGPAANGTVTEGVVEGTFVYTPNLYFAGPSDSFTYTLTDGNTVTNTATVTITLSNLVWYVNSAGSNGSGQSHNPFNNLTSAGTASLPGHTIYVHTGGAATTGDLVMDTDQTLHGQGATFMLNSLTIPGGPALAPTLTGTTTLANNTAVKAVNFSGATPALTATGVSGPIAIDLVNVSDGTTALSLTNVTGSVTVSNSTFYNTSGAEVLINGGTGAVSVGAEVASNAGRSIDIQNRTGGTVTFTGSITDSEQGIFLNANTGSAVAFAGALALSTGGNPAFTATGGGTITASSLTSTVTTSSGTAVNIAGTTIGAAGVTFQSVASSGGAANAIVLNGTGSGFFLVRGDGTLARNGSGGTISNTSGDAIQLVSANNVTLQSMTLFSNGSNPLVLADAIGTSGNHTIEVNGGSNLILSGVYLDAPDGTGLLALNLGGTNRLDHGTRFEHIGALAGHGIYVNNTDTNMTLFELNGVQMIDNSAGPTNFFFANSGTSNMTLTVRDSLFEDLATQALTVAAGGVSSTTGTLTSNILDNDFQNAKALGENNVGILVSNGATHTSLVQGNLFDNIAENGSLANSSIVRTQNAGGIMTATVTQNTIQNIAYSSGGRHAIGHIFEPLVFNAANSSTLFFTSNTVDNVTYTATNREAIFIDYRPAASGGEVTIENNDIDMPSAGPQQAMELRFRQTNPSTVNVLVRGNVVSYNSTTNFLDVDAEAAASVHLTVDGTNDVTNTSGTPGQTLDVATEAAGSSMCANITGNTLQGGAGTITVNEAAGALSVTQASAAALAAANGIPAGNVTVVGAPAFGGPVCTVP